MVLLRSNNPQPSPSEASAAADDGDDAVLLASSLRRAIARLPPNASRATVQAALAPHFGVDQHRLSNDSSSEDDDAATSNHRLRTAAAALSLLLLMLACDRGQLHAVRFLLEQHDGNNHNNNKNNADPAVLLLLLRHHHHPETGNTAAHHAARSGNLALWKYLEEAAAAAAAVRRRPTKDAAAAAAAAAAAGAAGGGGGGGFSGNDESAAGTTAGPPPFSDETTRTREEEEEEEEEEPILLSKPTPASCLVVSSHSSSALFSLLSSLNHHGDTPLMMACVAPEAVDLVKYMIGQLQSQATKACSSAILNARNRSNDSALSLACGHGNVTVVELLLSIESVINIEDDDWVKAQASLQKLKAVLKSITKRDDNDNNNNKNESTRSMVEGKRRDLQTCVTLVREALQKRADAVAAELLKDEEQSSSSSVRNSKNTKKNHADPSKQQARGKQNNNCDNSKSKQGNNDNKPSSRPNGVDTTFKASNETLKEKQESKTRNSQDTESNNTVVLTKLDDGTRAVAVPGTTLEEDTEGKLPITATQKSRPSPNDLLRQHAQQHTDSSVRDQLQALGCLDDAALLLLTPHGLALECSPAQLDGLESILERQLAAVREARAIQQRLRRATASVTTAATATPAAQMDDTQTEG